MYTALPLVVLRELEVEIDSFEILISIGNIIYNNEMVTR